MRLSVAVALVALASGCKDRSDPAPPDPPIKVSAGDAGIPGITTLPGYDPSAGHLDDDVGHRPPQGRPARPSTPIDVTLRSSPTGAMAAVDGTPIGPTPTFWPGAADGREHEFTFDLRGYALARYRFVPITSGVLHARLLPISDEPDAGVPPPPEVVPNRVAHPTLDPPPAPLPVKPDAWGEPAAPPTVVSPGDATSPGSSGLGPQP